MSVSQYSRELENIKRRISRLEKSKVYVETRAAKCDVEVAKIQIKSNDSGSRIKSKQRKIAKLQSDASDYRKKSAKYSKDIAKENKKLFETTNKLEKERQKETKKQEKILKGFQDLYEIRVKEMEENMLTEDDLNKDASNDEFDFFISHAYEDKKNFVDEFVRELRELDLKVWYDDNSIPWGWSLREEIDKGLRNSKYGIVILSPSYIEEGKYWTKKELDGLFQKESIDKGKIVPVWYDLNKMDVFNYSPMISDLKAMTSANLTPREMAAEFKKIIDLTN
ncbi:toll/interleukin-1 receptor domain-containing protein [Anaerococcus nagyae]|uniref:Toll/interleukin-1 receptor domain-containing protein n=1 Tax=Anaerococcus nagyae TaxID=1755241 RepID=A0A3E2TGS5_9FIRM|nr:toll/interleukin-1 receptor domain-containing protein [Anaerococcus nagyae]RGB75504.1 toll/interleukin-1 receptor domain-containing protein [Anaerococcus nagyae]